VTYYNYYLLDAQGFATIATRDTWKLNANNLYEAIRKAKIILTITSSPSTQCRRATVVESTDEGDAFYPIDVIIKPAEAETMVNMILSAEEDTP
jgi:hypothetical protein